MKNIFVDMDGVLTDFKKRYTELFAVTSEQMADKRDRKLYDMRWDQFVDQQHFTNLDWHKGGEDLIDFLRNDINPKHYNICILTSAGGMHRQREVQEQKLEWLSDQYIDWPAVVVPGRRFKAGFADKQSIIIDDTHDVCTSFVKAGGSAIEHTRTDRTLELLKLWMSL